MLVDECSLSRAWAKVFLHILDHPGTSVSPLVVSVHGFGANGAPAEDLTLRSALDDCLKISGKRDSETVAWTIFPESIWRLAQGDRHRFYDLYLKTWPHWRAMNPQANRRGLYFERLINYGRGEHSNQLEWIISSFQSRRGVRKSMLQASVFDPARDHVPDAQLGFPCLQHVTFVPDGDGLVVNAFYATQQLFDKAYGNWLGLCGLGHFMAQAMGLQLVRMNCFVGIEKLERITKGAESLDPIIDAARRIMSAVPPSSAIRSLA
jgi:hypothetical protein